MRRRDLIKVISGAAIAWPFAARAQQPKRVRRLGVLLGLAESDHDAQSWINAFRLRLEELGWQDGRNIQIDYRWAENDNNKIASYTSELVGLAPDALFVGSQPVFDSVRQATRTVPIVFVQVSDPVAQGVIKSLAEPGGNFTGFSNVDFSVAGKWLELLREIAPAITQTNVILNPENGTNLGHFRTIEPVARTLGVQLTSLGVHNAAEITRAIETAGAKPDSSLIVLTSPATNTNRDLIIALANRFRLPAVYSYRYFCTNGGLVSYGADIVAQFKGAATYVDLILRGEKPANLPVQLPTKFELVINLKAAKIIGLTVPPSLLARADEVIE